MAISDYSQTPAQNTNIAGIDISEGCPPGGLNDALRQMMADMAAHILAVQAIEYGGTGASTAAAARGNLGAAAASEVVSNTGDTINGDLTITGTLRVENGPGIELFNQFTFFRLDGPSYINLDANDVLIVRHRGTEEIARFDARGTGSGGLTTVMTREKADTRFVRRGSDSPIGSTDVLRVVRSGGVTAGTNYAGSAFEKRAFNPQSNGLGFVTYNPAGTWKPYVTSENGFYCTCERVA